MEHLKSFKIFESVIRNVFDDRVEYHNSEGQKHREDGPAVEFNNGSKFWCLNGKLHRIGGPAVEYANGDKYWYINGRCHREDGPAIERINGTKYWYLNGRLIYESQFIQTLTNQQPNPNLFIDLPIEDLEELSADLCDKYDGKIKKWCNFYAIYFKEKLDKNDPDLKSFENRLKDLSYMRARCPLVKVSGKSILIY